MEFFTLIIDKLLSSQTALITAPLLLINLLLLTVVLTNFLLRIIVPAMLSKKTLSNSILIN